MISGNDDRLAFVIETEAKLDGIRAARMQVRGLGTDAQQVSQRAVAGSQAQANAEQATATAVNRSIGMFMAKGAAVDRTSTQAVEAYRREGDALSANLARMGATEKQIDMIGAAIARTERLSGSATFGAHGARALQMQLDPVSSKARTAANAVSALTLSAGGLASGGTTAAIAAGSLAGSLAALSSSARLVAGSNAIGAVVTIIAVAISLMNKFKNATDETTGRFQRILSLTDDKDVQGAYTRARAASDAATRARAEGPSGADALKPWGIAENRRLKKAQDEAIANERLVYARMVEVTREGNKKLREEASQEAERRREQGERDTKSAVEQVFDLRNKTAQAWLTGSGNLERAQIIQVQAEAERRRRAIADMLIDETTAANLRVAIANNEEAEIARIRDDAARKRLEKSDKESKEQHDKEVALQKRREDVLNASLDAYVRGGESLQRVLIKMALDPIITELQGIAVRQAIKAAQHAAAFDFVGAAKHAAVAGLALGGARQVAQLGGGGGGAGGGAVGSAGGGGGSTFEPRSGGVGAGVVHLTLITRNPYGRDEIQNTLYELQRGGMLRLPPVQLPPTAKIERIG